MQNERGLTEKNSNRLAQVFEYLGPEGIVQSVAISLEIQRKHIAELEPMMLECLSFFECKQCGECCRDCSVQLTDDEMTVLLKRDGDTVFDLMDENIIIGNALKAPCGYLENNACGIHNVKPFVCRVYPFTLKYLDFLAIYLCPMGKEMANELQNFVEEYSRRRKSKAPSAGEERMLKQAAEEVQETSNLLFDTAGYQRGRVLEQAFFPYDVIPLFLKYLKSKKKKSGRETEMAKTSPSMFKKVFHDRGGTQLSDFREE